MGTMINNFSFSSFKILFVAKYILIIIICSSLALVRGNLRNSALLKGIYFTRIYHESQTKMIQYIQTNMQNVTPLPSSMIKMPPNLRTKSRTLTPTEGSPTRLLLTRITSRMPTKAPSYVSKTVHSLISTILPT